MNRQTVYSKYLKRIFGFIISFLLILILSPLLLIIAIMIKVKLGSPIFFIQERPGLNGKIFKMYKFRTMTNAKDKHGNLLPNSKRSTAFGNLLRSTSIDELPELYNILRGDMSFIGPRPLLKEYMPYYSRVENTRHDVRPGLTGLAQINGRNALDWDSRLNFDVEYVKNISFKNDLIILFKTIGVVLSKKGYDGVDNLKVGRLDYERSEGKG